MLKFQFPEFDLIAIAASTICCDEQLVGMRIERFAHFIPPASNRLHSELGSIMINADTHPTLIQIQLVNPVREAWWSDEQLTTAIALPESLQPIGSSSDAVLLIDQVWCMDGQQDVLYRFWQRYSLWSMKMERNNRRSRLRGRSLHL
jgi:hypothetical protein